jgi:hypothetical protein
VSPVLAFPDEVRRVIYTTDESVKGRNVSFSACGERGVCERGSLDGRDAGETVGRMAHQLNLGVRGRRRIAA